MSGTSNLVHRLREILRLNRELVEMTSRFLEKDSDDDRALEDLLARRRKSIARLKDLDSDLPVNSEEWTRLMDRLPEEEAEEVKKLIRDLRPVLETVLEIDGKLKNRTREDLQEIGAELDRTRQGQKALKGYGPPKGVASLISRRE